MCTLGGGKTAGVETWAMRGSAPLRQVNGVGDAAPLAIAYIERMKKLFALIAPLAFVAFASPVLAEKIPLAQISSYLNSLTTAQTDFTQVNSDGTIATGKLYIKRPGRIRFEYAPPDRSLVLASAGTVAIFDAKSNQPPEQYPLSRTPLNLILAENVNLGRSKMVVSHQEDENATQVVAQDPEHPEYGTIGLVFTANPVALRQWVITDDLGQQTTVILGALANGQNFQPSLFNIDSEVKKRAR